MMPRWKVQRELNRMGEQIRALISYPLEPILKAKHDRLLHKHIRQWDGARPATQKVAIYLIYQPRGLLASTIETCRHLTENGYAVMVVSNAPVADLAREALAPEVWRIVERPNYGYDFGGYRDGVRLINEAGLSLDCLVILNDSVWWPIFPGDTILQRMEQAGKDVVGTIMHQPPRRKLRIQGQAQPFLESYFFWFGAVALRSEAFRAFWRDYRPSSIKYNAVHRGERRLTPVMVRAGLSTMGLFTRAGLLSALAEAGPTAILQALRYGAYIDPEFRAAADALLERDPAESAWQTEALAFIDRMTVKRGFHAALPVASIRHLGATFLKKAPAAANGAIHHHMRDQVLAAIAAGELPAPIPAVGEELRLRQREGAAAVGR